MKIVIILTLVFFERELWAAEKKAPAKKKDLLTTSLDYVDETQNVVEESWRGLYYNIDSFFSDKRYKAEENKSKIMLYWIGYKKEGQPFKNTFDFALKVHLPKTTKRLSITLEKERDEILDATNSYANRAATANSRTGEPAQPSENSYAAAASYILSDNPVYKTSFTTGLKLLLPLDPFAKLTFYNDHRWKYFHVGGEQKFIMYRQDGFSEFTRLTFGIPFSRDLYLSQNNVLAWKDETDAFSLRDDLALGYAIDDKKGISLSVGANAVLSPFTYYTGYDTSISYRHLLFRDWFYGSLTVGAEFPKSQNFKQTNFAQIRFDIQ